MRLKSSLLKYRKNYLLSLRLKSSISRNIRNFFRVDFLIFQPQKVPPWNLRSFPTLGQESSISWNIIKEILIKCKKVFNLMARNFHLSKYDQVSRWVFYIKKYKKVFSYKHFEAGAEKWPRYPLNRLLLLHKIC